MPLMKYKAVDLQGRVRRGALNAGNKEELELRLSRLDLFLIRTYEADGRYAHLASLVAPLFKGGGVPRKALILYCVYMEQLLRSGVTIPAAMEEIRLSVAHPRFAEVITAMIEDIHGGTNLSDAMRAYPDLFPTLFPSLVKVGEQTGKLEEIFDSLASNLKWEDELLARARKAVRYPLFVGFMVLGLFFFLMTYLAPRLLNFLPEMGAEMPFHTRVLMAVSDFVMHWWPLFFVVPAALYVGSKLACRMSPTFRLRQDHLQLRIWFFGPLMRKIHLLRFAHTFALMYQSGVPILSIMEMGGELSGNKAVRHAILQARQYVSDGRSVSASFQAAELFPPPIPRLLQVGEKAGKLDGALLNVGYFFDREIRESIDTIQSLLEPVLTLFVGVLLAWIILSVLGPIYDVITHVQF